MSKETFLKQQYHIYKEKNKRYGNSFVESIEEWGDITFAVTIANKIRRARELIADKNLNIDTDESLNDTVRDIFNYIAIFESFTMDKDVYESMEDILDKFKIIETYLFDKYNNTYLLNPNSQENVDLYHNILKILQNIINMEE